MVDLWPRSVEAVAREEAVVEDGAAGAVEAVVGDLDPPALSWGPPPRFLLVSSLSAALSFRSVVEESLSSALELRSFILFFGALVSSLSSSSS